MAKILLLCTKRDRLSTDLLFFFIADSSVQCQVYAEMGEFGVYDVDLTAGSTESSTGFDCAISTAKEPVDIYMRQYTFLLICELSDALDE